jgi:hypothetical protein
MAEKIETDAKEETLMAFAARIEPNAVTKNADGSVSIKYTEGDVPLPASWGGNAMVNTPDGWATELEAAEARVANDLKFIQIAKGYKADSSFGTTFANTINGKTATLDLTGLATPIVVG